jgi:hypothetical protein
MNTFLLAITHNILRTEEVRIGNHICTGWFVWGELRYIDVRSARPLP